MRRTKTGVRTEAGITTMTTIDDPKRRMPPRSVRINVILVAPKTTLTAANERNKMNATGRLVIILSLIILSLLFIHNLKMIVTSFVPFVRP